MTHQGCRQVGRSLGAEAGGLNPLSARCGADAKSLHASAAGAWKPCMHNQRAVCLRLLCLSVVAVLLGGAPSRDAELPRQCQKLLERHQDHIRDTAVMLARTYRLGVAMELACS